MLLHKLNNVTQVIAGVNSLVRLSGDSGPIARCGADLDHAGGMLARLGWLVGALGHGVGSDLCTTRHEERALDWLLGLLVEALRREGRHCELRGTLPCLPPTCGSGACWELARELHARAVAAPAGATLEYGVRLVGARLVLDCEVRA